MPLLQRSFTTRQTHEAQSAIFGVNLDTQGTFAEQVVVAQWKHILNDASSHSEVTVLYNAACTAPGQQAMLQANYYACQD